MISYDEHFSIQGLPIVYLKNYLVMPFVSFSWDYLFIHLFIALYWFFVDLSIMPHSPTPLPVPWPLPIWPALPKQNLKVHPENEIKQ